MPASRARSKSEAKSKAGKRVVPGNGSGKALRSLLHALIHKDGSFYVVECLELPVVTQGETLDEAVKNLYEALSLHLEGEDLPALGLVPDPRVEVIYDMGLACPA
ncbi:MAG: type II toxin-antitoxin system HicB family antitoxin [Candidatus Korobacteraceae bacterium]